MRAWPPTLTIFGGFGASKNLFFKENLRGRAQAEGALCAKQAWPDVERWRCSRHLHRGSGTIHSLILGTASAQLGAGMWFVSSLPTQDMSTMSNWLMHSRSSIGANVGRQARFAETWNYSCDTICKIFGRKKWHSHSSFPCWVLAWRVWPYCPLLFMHQMLILLPDFFRGVPNDVHAGVCNVCDQIPNERRF